ncbi:MAG TPA: Uma2 family endonuclease [Phycisphaerae bacterium]
MPLRVDQYHDMIASGILQEGAPYELLDGLIVRKDRSGVGENPMSVGLGHAWAVKNLGNFDAKLRRLRCHMQTQQPVTLAPYHEPEPDGAIVVGSIDDYRKKHITAKDVLCIIEVADSSLQFDRKVKLPIYADSGIPQYVIINLPERLVELYEQPLPGMGRYARSTTLRPGQSIALRAAAGRELKVPIRRLLP